MSCALTPNVLHNGGKESLAIQAELRARTFCMEISHANNNNLGSEALATRLPGGRNACWRALGANLAGPALHILEKALAQAAQSLGQRGLQGTVGRAAPLCLDGRQLAR